MPTVAHAWVLNLDAELELAAGSRPYQPSAHIRRLLPGYAAMAHPLLGPADMLLSEGQATPALAGAGPGSGRLGRAWCPTRRALATFRRAGITPEAHPDLDIVRRVNHRAFAHRPGWGLPGQRFVTDMGEIEALVSADDRAWLCKRPLALAGRGQRRLPRSGVLDDASRAWLTASLRDGGVIVEPLVVPLVEFCLHGFLFPDGQRQMGHVCVQSVSSQGAFQSARRATEQDITASETLAFLTAGEAVAEALREAGYFGPFAIDGHRHHDPAEGRGHQGFCAVSEINARYTMGFVTGFPVHPSNIILPPARSDRA